jgi:predicted AAA+ superfamily ATPase
MKYIHRSLEELVKQGLKPNRAVVILGARRVGKTELIKNLLSNWDEPYLLLNGDDQMVQDLFEPRTVTNYQRLLGDVRFLVIDEAQSISDVGLKLKLMLDSIPDLKILVSGSSVFDLNNKLGEPLVGRKTTFCMYPLAQMEFNKTENLLETKQRLEERLVLGTYPELEQLSTRAEKIEYLMEQMNSYLFKDILAFEGIRKRDVIVSLLRMIAFRVGSEISIEGIANELQIGKATVDRYLDLFSKVFIIHKVTGYSRNLDNEITKKNKWYFYDNGIRNALINNFNFLNLRDDQGKLWENYLISERIKRKEYLRIHAAHYFWRTHTKQEIDLVEEKDGSLCAFEFKWTSKKAVKAPALWSKYYPTATFEVIHPQNYLDFISE